ncbi:thioesterase II family protein [Oscillatoria sp. FACHB-1407]|uniref:thioesterase II family protein n=1 Tax=Oscillatoria sp. FACHB-1407 TaxID=2692847 RepID=UPI0030DD0112
MKRPNPNPNATLRLFCFPYAGAGASIFRHWSANLPPYVEVCPIQLPGREERIKESLFTQLPPLVQTLAHSLQGYLDIPFAFFGHSLGGLISFELARQLRIQQSPEPIHLFISGRRAPQASDRNPLLHTLPESEFLQELRSLNRTPEKVLTNSELMQLLLPILRADFSICETYTYLDEPPLDCSISVLGGLDDAGEPIELLELWRSQTRSSFSMYLFPGDHFFLHRSQQLLLETLDNQLCQLAD